MWKGNLPGAGILVLGVFLLISGTGSGVADRETGNSCVRCHADLPSSGFPGVKSHGWAGSIHQQKDVTCEKCHGGKPEVAEKGGAHTGVLGSRNPESAVYFKNIPATCGACHGAEFYEFSQSLHYKVLEATGRGPECVTCHGSMVTRILSPANLVAVCEQCHNDRLAIRPYIPEKARAVLLLLRASEALLAVKEGLHTAAEGTETAERLSAARSNLRSAKVKWHRFDLDEITGYLQEMYDSLARLPDS